MFKQLGRFNLLPLLVANRDTYNTASVKNYIALKGID